MRYIIYTDPHWGSYSSILRNRGDKYSVRLENLIKTINWVETMSEEYNCDNIICLGDFFDRADISSEELTALQEIRWTNKTHYFLVGNHEMGRSNLEFSSSHLFNLCPQCNVIDKPLILYDKETKLVFLPYILERERKPLVEYLKDTQTYTYTKTLILSHNDIKDIQMGQWKSKEGFVLEEIKNNCNLFINGHLHNSMMFDNVINLGNITGQNFSEDATKYPHQAILLDTDNGCVDFITNPFALNFYKIDLSNYDEDSIKKYFISKLVNDNIVLTVKVDENKVPFIKKYLEENYTNILSYRVIANIEHSDKQISTQENISIDYIDKFKCYITNELGTSNLVMEELEKVTGI